MTQSEHLRKSPQTNARATSNAAATGAPLSRPGGASARIDGKHDARLANRAGTDGDGEKPLLENPTDGDVASWAFFNSQDQLVNQHAQELGEQLQTARRKLEQREALLNARQAQLENAARAARLREQERQRELNELEASRQRLVQELEDRRLALSAAEHSVDQDLAHAETKMHHERGALERRQETIHQQQQRLAKQAERLHAATQLFARSRSDQDHELERGRQELQLETVSAQLQSRRLLRQAERAAAGIDDQRRELEQRRAECVRVEQHLVLREQGLGRAEAELAARECQLKTQHRDSLQSHSDVERQRRELRQQRTELHLQQQQFKQQRVQLEQRESEVEARAEALEQQQRVWTTEAIQLNSHREALQRAQETHQREIAKAWVELRGKLEKAELDEAAWREEQHRQQAALADRERELTAREEKLQTLRRDLQAIQLQNLELRVAMEELLAANAPASDSDRLAQLPAMRRRLADAYQAEQAELQSTKQSIVGLLERLHEQRASAGAARADIEGWFKRRQRQIEEEAARLIARQHEIDLQAAAMRRQSVKWDEERLQLQHEIRRLALNSA